MTPTDTRATRAQLTSGFVDLMHQIKAAVACGLSESDGDREKAVTTHQLEVLSLLTEPEEQLTMNELARRQGCAMSTASAVVERLCRQGLLERRPDPEDRRVVRVQMTQEAAEAVAKLDANRRQMAERLLAPLSDDELRRLIALMSKIAPTTEVSHG